MKKDFLSLYHYLAGDTEIPRGYHGWAVLSLIAALAQKNVWFEKFKGSRMYPNIYVLLIGPSGVGKGSAISHAMRILNAAELDPPLNIYRGSTTHAHLEDMLGKVYERKWFDDEADEWKKEIVYPPSHLWLIMDELSNNLGDGKLAERFIKMITEMFTGDYPISGGTRTHGHRLLDYPCLNWFAGTTIDWLFDVLSKKDVFSGATARMFVCFREYQDVRFAEPQSPPDYDEVLKLLVNKIRAISILEGPFRFTAETRRIKKKWYDTRPTPKDNDLLAAWKRGDDLVIKLCMIFSLLDSSDLIIRPQHFVKARATFDNAFKDLDYLMELAYGTQEKEGVKFVENIIKDARRINRTALARKVYKKGILAARLDVITKDIESRGLVKIEYTQKGGRIYEYIG